MSDAEMIRDLTRRLDAQVAEENAAAEALRAQNADYKIQIWFRTDRVLFGESTFTLSAWESGKRLHGGGDELMRICERLPDAPRAADDDVLGMADKDIAARGGCRKFIPGGLAVYGRLQCPHCSMHHYAEHIATGKLYRATMTDAAKILEEWWRRLDCRASLYAKYQPTDPRSQAMQTEHGYAKAMELKGLTVYRLQSILKDTENGREVANAFRAFLTA